MTQREALTAIAHQANNARTTALRDIEQGNESAYDAFIAYGKVADVAVHAALSARSEPQAIERALAELRREAEVQESLPAYATAIRWGIGRFTERLASLQLGA